MNKYKVVVRMSNGNVINKEANNYEEANKIAWQYNDKDWVERVSIERIQDEEQQADYRIFTATQEEEAIEYAQKYDRQIIKFVVSHTSNTIYFFVVSVDDDVIPTEWFEQLEKYYLSKYEVFINKGKKLESYCAYDYADAVDLAKTFFTSDSTKVSIVKKRQWVDEF